MEVRHKYLRESYENEEEKFSEDCYDWSLLVIIFSTVIIFSK